MSSFNYTVIARRPSQMVVSRHGISRSQGGQEVARQNYQYPDTPVYLALEMERDEHPDCDLDVVGLPKAGEAD